MTAIRNEVIDAMGSPPARRGAVRAGMVAWMLAVVTGCSSLPTIVPDMAARPSRPVQLEGAHGPLSAQQSKAILSRLASRGVETSIFDRHMALEEAIVGSPLVVGVADG